MKKSIFLISILFLCGFLIYLGCKRKGVTDSSVNNPGDFKTGNYTGVSVVNGVMTFVDSATFASVMDDLYVADTSASPDTTLTDEHPVLRDFENYFTFNSLRKIIQTNLNNALNNNTWTPQNDPDDYFISDPYMRTVMNQFLEYKIGTDIYKVLNECTMIKVKNNDWTLLYQMRDSNNWVSKIDNDNIEVYDLGTSCSSCNLPLDFDIDSVFSDKRKITFVASGSYTSNTTYTWHFGDGTTATGISVTHQFPSMGNYKVSLVKKDGSCYSTKGFWLPLNDCKSDFQINTIDPDNFVVDFQQMWKLSSNASQISSFTWTFGDPNSNSNTNTTDWAPSHTYPGPGTYDVYLTITDNDGCTNTSYDQVTIKAKDKCCVKWSHSKESVSNQSNDKDIKCTIWNETYMHGRTTHGARLRYYEKNTSGKWKKKKNSTLYVTAAGTWWTNKACTESNTGLNTDIEYNAHICDVAWGDWGVWRLDNKSFTALYDVYDNNNSHIFEHDLSICDDNCK